MHCAERWILLSKMKYKLLCCFSIIFLNVKNSNLSKKRMGDDNLMKLKLFIAQVSLYIILKVKGRGI